MERLTSCEEEIMSVIWNYEGDIPEAMIREKLEGKYGKVYARTTVATFLMKMEKKGYLEKYRNKRHSYVKAMIPKQDYLKAEFDRLQHLFFDGSKEGFKICMETYIF